MAVAHDGFGVPLLAISLLAPAQQSWLLRGFSRHYGVVGRLAEVDIPFFELCYGVEIDGPHHLLPEQAAKDRARDRMLARTCGWSIDRYLWFELEDDPERFVREVQARLRELKADG